MSVSNSTQRFRQLPDYPDYRFDKNGNAWTKRMTKANPRWKKLKPGNNGHGYLFVLLYNQDGPKSFYLHRIILQLFKGPCPPKMQACHNNGVRHDCRIKNLRWDTRKNNEFDKWRHGTRPFGERHQHAVLTDKIVKWILSSHKNGTSVNEIAKRLGRTVSHIWDVVRRRIWTHVTI